MIGPDESTPVLANVLEHQLIPLGIRREQNPFVSGCEFQGCARDGVYVIDSPDNKHWTTSCQYHITYQVLEFATKEEDRRLNRVYCVQCEARGYICDCPIPDGTKVKID